MNSVTHPVVNVLGFQVCWWSCALLPQALSVSIIFLLLAVHLSLHPQKQQEFFIIVLAGSCGMMADTFLTLLGVFQFSSFPWWLMGLWLALGATLNNSFKFLHDRLFIAAVLGAIAAPLSYFAGATFGVLSFANTSFSLLAIGLVWLFLFPLLLKLAQHLSSTGGQSCSATA